MASNSAWSWHEMLEAFRALGGTAQNIVPGTGRFGRGLFPLDTAEPVLVRIPSNLLFRVKDIEFADGNLRIRDSASIPQAEREFFDRYESGFSWGAGGRTESVAFVNALDALPPEVRQLLITDFAFHALFRGDAATRSQKHFLQSRVVGSDGEPVIMPLIELANHHAGGLRYERGTHLRIQGRVRDEVLVRYGAHDAYSIFQAFGFLSREPASFSLSTKVGIEDRELTIGRDTAERVRRGKLLVPKMTSGDGKIALSYLMIGHRKLPGLSRGTCRTLLQEAGIKNPDDAFDGIRYFNEMKFIELLQALEPYEGDMITKLRTMARYQLEAMTFCIGSRELAPLSLPVGKTWSLSTRQNWTQ